MTFIITIFYNDENAQLLQGVPIRTVSFEFGTRN